MRCVYWSVVATGGRFYLTCNPNYSVGMLGTVTRWTPVKNLTFSAEVLWMHLNTGMQGKPLITPGSGAATQVYYVP